MKNLLIILIFLSSCSSVKKIFHKKDSTVIQKIEALERVNIDSSSEKDLIWEESGEVHVDFGDKGIYVPYVDSGIDRGIYITPVNPADYFSYSWDGEKLVTNQPVKRIVFKDKKRLETKDSTGKNEVKESFRKEEKKVTVKEKSKEVKKKKFPTFQMILVLMIVLSIIIYRNRKKIVAWLAGFFV